MEIGKDIDDIFPSLRRFSTVLATLPLGKGDEKIEEIESEKVRGEESEATVFRFPNQSSNSLSRGKE